ncbi:hypothetical protein GYMLUDRAFT_150173 [Collybiopsis luxurians FD-317 M1]|nr:hypothetical protein GYMLUDRAFT_150173 [Collybiopsis luxurians FD-317 M1]
MESNDFTQLAAIHLPASSRLLASACCPDKDLFVLITRIGSYDRMSLWKLQGSKIWEVDASTEGDRIVGIAWSPDGQTIAVAHDPPSITLHSIQDGRSERVLFSSLSDGLPAQLTDIWWFPQAKPAKSPIPDIFRRNNIITGSAHSVLRVLPLLDPLRDESQQLTATDLFAFQGSQTSARRAAAVPEVIKGWPALQPDPLSASVNVPNPSRKMQSGVIDEVDDTNLDSILCVADRSGQIACFLDGTYPLGSFSLSKSKSTVASLFKHPKCPILLVHPTYGESSTDLLPTHVSLSLLEERKVRDFARLSTSARELCWYVLRVIEEMRAAWLGSETATGARELGPKWIKAYEAKQRDQYNLNPSAILDLTMLLLTDRATEALADYLGSGQQMSERGVQKWDSAVTEALVKLRDYSEKRLVPACQRLHLLLGEVRGWASIPTIYAAFDISSISVNQCLAMLKQAILLASWLAAAARRELNRFKEFMSWLRYETQILNPSSETPPPIRHDILEVNQYFISGLEKSAIDKWFVGPVPTCASQDVGVPSYGVSANVALQKAREFIERRVPLETATEAPLDRNLFALSENFVRCCREVFERPSGAATRVATISVGYGSALDQTRAPSPQNNRIDLLIREKTTVDTSGEVSRKDGYYVQYLMLHAPSTSEHRSYVCFVRQRYGHSSSHVEVSVHECCLRLGDQESEHAIGVDLLALEFFDEETVVMVYRTGQAYIGTLTYADLGYQEFQQTPGDSVIVSRESLIESAIQGLGAGQLRSGYLPIKQSRGLKGCKTGAVSLAVNGRVGRRVACVADSKGMGLETFDLEGDEGEEGDTTLDEDR